MFAHLHNDDAAYCIEALVPFSFLQCTWFLAFYYLFTVWEGVCRSKSFVRLSAVIRKQINMESNGGERACRVWVVQRRLSCLVGEFKLFLKKYLREAEIIILTRRWHCNDYFIWWSIICSLINNFNRNSSLWKVLLNNMIITITLCRNDFNYVLISSLLSLSYSKFHWQLLFIIIHMNWNIAIGGKTAK